MYLVLDRKVNGEILIGGNIRIKILEIGRTRVKLGINAPKEIEVLRKEVLDREQD